MKWKAVETFKRGLLSSGSRDVGRGIHAYPLISDFGG